MNVIFPFFFFFFREKVHISVKVPFLCKRDTWLFYVLEQNTQISRYSCHDLHYLPSWEMVAVHLETYQLQVFLVVRRTTIVGIL
jgi:hypothetical protein